MNTLKILTIGVLLLLITGCTNDNGTQNLSADNSLPLNEITPLEGDRSACDEPVPLYGKSDPRAPGYIVVFKDGIIGNAVNDEVNRLSDKYGIEVKYIYSAALGGFFADMPETTLDSLRCEDSISFIEYNHFFSVGDPVCVCDKPAPLFGKSDPMAPGYIVVFKEIIGNAVNDEVNRLSDKYGIEVKHIYSAVLGGFAADMPETTLDSLRCEDSIAFIECNQQFTLF